MSERRIVVDHMKLAYTGLFDVQQLYLLIDEWLYEKNFDKREFVNQEHVKPDGKYIEIVLEPWKRLSDYIRTVIKIRLRMLHVKDVTVEQEDGKKVKLQEGTIQITFDGYVETDYEDRWEQKPFYFFLRTMFDKFLYRSYSTDAGNLVAENVNQLHDSIKSFLNLYRHQFGVMKRPELWKL